MIKTYELNLVNNPISKMPPLIQANVLKALEDGMKLAEVKSKTEYLTGPRPEKLGVVTGMLRRSVMSKVIKGSGNIFAVGILGVTNLVYARIHELGGLISDHIIAAKNVPYLVFFWKKKGVWFRGKSVHHPAKVPSRPYLRPALEGSLENIRNLIELAINDAHSRS